MTQKKDIGDFFREQFNNHAPESTSAEWSKTKKYIQSQNTGSTFSNFAYIFVPIGLLGILLGSWFIFTNSQNQTHTYQKQTAFNQAPVNEIGISTYSSDSKQEISHNPSKLTLQETIQEFEVKPSATHTQTSKNSNTASLLSITGKKHIQNNASSLAFADKVLNENKTSTNLNTSEVKNLTSNTSAKESFRKPVNIINGNSNIAESTDNSLESSSIDDRSASTNAPQSTVIQNQKNLQPRLQHSATKKAQFDPNYRMSLLSAKNKLSSAASNRHPLGITQKLVAAAKVELSIQAYAGANTSLTHKNTVSYLGKHYKVKESMQFGENYGVAFSVEGKNWYSQMGVEYYNSQTKLQYAPRSYTQQVIVEEWTPFIYNYQTQDIDEVWVWHDGYSMVNGTWQYVNNSSVSLDYDTTLTMHSDTSWSMHHILKQQEGLDSSLYEQSGYYTTTSLEIPFQLGIKQQWGRLSMRLGGAIAASKVIKSNFLALHPNHHHEHHAELTSNTTWRLNYQLRGRVGYSINDKCMIFIDPNITFFSNDFMQSNTASSRVRYSFWGGIAWHLN